MNTPPNMAETKRIFNSLWALTLGEKGNNSQEVALATTMLFGVVLATLETDEARELMCDAAMGYSLNIEELFERFAIARKH